MSDVKKFFTKGTLKKGTQPIVEPAGKSILIEAEFPSIDFKGDIQLRIVSLDKDNLKAIIEELKECFYIAILQRCVQTRVQADSTSPFLPARGLWDFCYMRLEATDRTATDHGRLYLRTLGTIRIFVA